MKIILDHKDLKSKLTTLLASEGIGLENDPKWGMDENGLPYVTLEVTPIPAEVKAKTIGEHLEVFLLDKLISILSGIENERSDKIYKILQNIQDKYDYIATALAAKGTPTTEPAIHSKKKDKDVNIPLLTINTPEKKTVTYLPGIEKQQEAQQRMLEEINRRIEEEAQEVERSRAPNEFDTFPG